MIDQTSSFIVLTQCQLWRRKKLSPLALAVMISNGKLCGFEIQEICLQKSSAVLGRHGCQLGYIAASLNIACRNNTSSFQKHSVDTTCLGRLQNM